MIDLHIHTDLSDGTDTIPQLVQKVVDGGINVFTVTDHDNIIGNRIIDEKFLPLLAEKKINFLHGVELSTDFFGDYMHLLVFGFDLDNPVLAKIMDQINSLRLKRIEMRLDFLEKEFNIYFTDEEKTWLYSQNNPAKMHIAYILIQKGLAHDIGTAFDKYLYHKFPKTKLDGRMVAKELSDAGLVVGIAHPLGGNKERRLSAVEFEEKVKVMKDYGIRFLECYYSLYNEEERELIKSVADKYEMKLSGGSDYHGSNKTVELGDLGIGYQPKIQDFTVLDIVEYTINT
jgi:predicted metal-dependent phosphoesterase TrpH